MIGHVKALELIRFAYPATAEERWNTGILEQHLPFGRQGSMIFVASC